MVTNGKDWTTTVEASYSYCFERKNLRGHTVSCVMELTIPYDRRRNGPDSYESMNEVTHYLYQEMLNRVTQLEGEQGLVVPFNAVISAQSQGITASGQANIVTSLATNNLRKVLLTMSPITEATINYPICSAFGNNSLSGLQFRVGSLNEYPPMIMGY